jgi:hypothetical protein
VKVLIKNDRVFSVYVQALRKCRSWPSANMLAEALPGIEKLSGQQMDELVAAYNETSELRGGWGFNGTRPGTYGAGLVSHLNRLGTREFRFTNSRLIEARS